MKSMTLTVVVLDPFENFIKFLDPDLVDITETHEYAGLRTADVTYKFTDLVEEKADLELFKHGNKIWVSNDNNVTDCLYVINTNVKEDVFKENSFTFPVEEVLVELNNAPLFSHTELSDSCFYKVIDNGREEVRVDWNSLNYWFGEWFNIGVVQNCLSDYAQRISLTGTMSRMSLLRQIEEETGNVFVTRYEKDVLSNTIHRYLDFLNPNNLSKDWSLNLEYHFWNQSTLTVPTDKAWEITPFNTGGAAESVAEDVCITDGQGNVTYDGSSHDIQNAEKDSTYDSADDDLSEENSTSNVPLTNVNPEDCVFRITDGVNMLNTYGEIYTEDPEDEEQTPLEWSASDVSFTYNNETDKTVLISLVKTGNTIGLGVNNLSYAIVDIDDEEYYKTIGVKSQGYIDRLAHPEQTDTSMNDAYQPQYIEPTNGSVIPDDSYFEIYDAVNDKVVFRTCLNISIGHVHPEVLNFGFNLENVVHEVDESNTYTAVSPILSLNEGNTESNSLTRNELADLIERWKDLEIKKGDDIPMIVQKITVKATSDVAAKQSFGIATLDGIDSKQSNDPTNWWCRPYHPQDNVDDNTASNSTWEFWRATANWKAPYTKNKGDMHVATDKAYTTEYQNINPRKDNRKERLGTTPKMGFTESSDEDLYAIYNQVALYLKEHENPTVDISVDVANLRNKTYNDYKLHDKVYIKLPDTKNLITARVIKTVKQSHDVAKNTIELANYTELNTIKTLQHETILTVPNNNDFKYPNSKTLTVTLENLEHDNSEYSVQYPANKLVMFTLYDVSEGSRTFKKVYSKRTDVHGKAKLPMKYDPGKYEIDIYFGGDEEYEESHITVKINVGGKKEVKQTTTKNNTKSKTTKKTTVKKTTYYDKYGRSPDKKRVCAIGKPSASGDSGAYDFYEMEFENVCPKCHKKGTLFWDIFYAGNEHSNWGRVKLTGNREGGSAEGHIFCENQKCDGDWSCQGHEHGYTGTHLKVTRGRKKSSKSEVYKMKKGKKVYQSVTKTGTSTTDKNKDRKIKASGISSKVKNLALRIVGNSTGYAALRKICNWMDKNIWYSYYSGFVRSPDRVLSTKHGNCCDQTRLFLQLCDAAGLTEYMTLKYRHVYNHVYAVIKFRKSGNTVTVDCASDVHGCYAYICRDYRTSTLRETVYPTRPF